jgi:hypothetical protein
MALRYAGDGEFLPGGPPARDLTDEEAAVWADVIAAHEQATGRTLYVPAEPIEGGD